MEAGSADTGFFQEMPELQNQFYDDASLQRVFKLFVPAELRKQVEPDLAQIGSDVISQRIFDWITDTERNLPYLKGSGRTVFGRPTSEVINGEGWRNLQKFGIEKGFVAFNYATSYGAYSRLLQMMRFHLWEASSGGTTIPCGMTDGAARLMHRHLASSSLEPTQRRVFQDAYDRLTSQDPTHAWTSGQWMSERSGGSDVSKIEAIATRLSDADAAIGVDSNGLPLGPWEVSGFKCFCTAIDAGMCLLLAKTAKGGLSVLFAPTKRRSAIDPSKAEMNGIHIVRLKDKFGTNSAATAEIELRRTRAWLVGQEGNGIPEIINVLDISRTHCAIGCLGNVSRALSVARAFSTVRMVSAGPGGRQQMALAQSPQHVRTLATLTSEYHGMLLLSLYATYIIGLEERMKESPSPFKANSPLFAPPSKIVAPLMRVLGSVHKAYNCKHAIPLIHEAGMECLGGIGYLMNHENEALNMARLFRDSSVNTIWEGTTDVLSTDLVRTLSHPKGGPVSLDAMEWLIQTATNPGASSSSSDVASIVLQKWKNLRTRVQTQSTNAGGRESLVADARSVLFGASEILIASLMVYDANSDGSPASQAMLDRFLLKKNFVSGDSGASVPVTEDLASNTLVVYGEKSAHIQQPASAKL